MTYFQNENNELHKISYIRPAMIFFFCVRKTFFFTFCIFEFGIIQDFFQTI